MLGFCWPLVEVSGPLQRPVLTGIQYEQSIKPIMIPVRYSVHCTNFPLTSWYWYSTATSSTPYLYRTAAPFLQCSSQSIPLVLTSPSSSGWSPRFHDTMYIVNNSTHPLELILVDTILTFSTVSPLFFVMFCFSCFFLFRIIGSKDHFGSRIESGTRTIE